MFINIKVLIKRCLMSQEPGISDSFSIGTPAEIYGTFFMQKPGQIKMSSFYLSHDFDLRGQTNMAYV